MPSSPNRYLKGQTAHLVVDWNDMRTGTAQTYDPPGGSRFIVTDPTGSQNTYTATKQSAGVYVYDLVLPTVGVWYYRAETLGDVVTGVEENELIVEAGQTG